MERVFEVINGQLSEVFPEGKRQKIHKDKSSETGEYLAKLTSIIEKFKNSSMYEYYNNLRIKQKYIENQEVIGKLNEEEVKHYQILENERLQFYINHPDFVKVAKKLCRQFEKNSTLMWENHQFYQEMMLISGEQIEVQDAQQYQNNLNLEISDPNQFSGMINQSEIVVQPDLSGNMNPYLAYPPEIPQQIFSMPQEISFPSVFPYIYPSEIPQQQFIEYSQPINSFGALSGVNSHYDATGFPMPTFQGQNDGFTQFMGNVGENPKELTDEQCRMIIKRLSNAGNSKEKLSTMIRRCINKESLSDQEAITCLKYTNNATVAKRILLVLGKTNPPQGLYSSESIRRCKILARMLIEKDARKVGWDKVSQIIKQEDKHVKFSKIYNFFCNHPLTNEELVLTARLLVHKEGKRYIPAGLLQIWTRVPLENRKV